MHRGTHATNPTSGHATGRVDLRTTSLRPTPGTLARTTAIGYTGVPRPPDRAGAPPGTLVAPRGGVFQTVRSHRLGLPFLRELLLMAGVFLAYRQIRFLTRGDTAVALDHGRAVMGLEQHLHVAAERAVQRAAMSQMAIIHLLDRYYVVMHFTVTSAFLVWAFARRPEAYARIRAWFVSVTLAALAIHVAYPLAPPRMLSGHGFVDTLAVYGPRIYSADTTKSVANQFVAMPSLHFGWSVMVAVALIAVTRRRVRWLALAHPALTLLAIVATANHYFADAAVALVLVAVGAVAVQWGWSRMSRPAACALVPAPVAARPAAGWDWAVPARLAPIGPAPAIDLRPEPWTVDATLGTAMAVGPPVVTSSPTAPAPSIGAWRVEMHRPAPAPKRRRHGQDDPRPDRGHRCPDGADAGADGAVDQEPSIDPVLDDGRDGELVGCSGC